MSSIHKIDVRSAKQFLWKPQKSFFLDMWKYFWLEFFFSFTCPELNARLRLRLSIMSVFLGLSGRVVSNLSALLHLPQEKHTASGAERRAGFRLHSIHLPIARGREGSLLDSPSTSPTPTPPLRSVTSDDPLLEPRLQTGGLWSLPKVFPAGVLLTTRLGALMRFSQLLFPSGGPSRKSLMPWAFFTPPPPITTTVLCVHFIILLSPTSSTPVWYCLVVSWGESWRRCSGSVCLFMLKLKSIRFHLLLSRTCSQTRLRPNPPNPPSACWASSCVDGESGGSGVMWDTFAFFSSAGRPCALNSPPWFPAFVIQVLWVPQTRLSFHPRGRTLGGILLWSFPSLGSDCLCEEQTSSLQDIISRFRVQGSYSERTAQGLF